MPKFDVMNLITYFEEIIFFPWFNRFISSFKIKFDMPLLQTNQTLFPNDGNNKFLDGCDFVKNTYLPSYQGIVHLNAYDSTLGALEKNLHNFSSGNKHLIHESINIFFTKNAYNFNVNNFCGYYIIWRKEKNVFIYKHLIMRLSKNLNLSYVLRKKIQIN